MSEDTAITSVDRPSEGVEGEQPVAVATQNGGAGAVDGDEALTGVRSEALRIRLAAQEEAERIRAEASRLRVSTAEECERLIAESHRAAADTRAGAERLTGER